MKMCGFSLRRMVMTALLCGTFALIGARAIGASDTLENVVEPMLAGVPVLGDNSLENPTMYNFTFRNIEVHPFAGASVGYDSNLYLTDTARIDDPYYQVGPGLLLRTNPNDSDRFSMRWLSNFDGRFYFNESKANTVQISTWLDSTLKGNRWSINLIGGGGRFEDPINATFADKAPRAVGEARLTGHWDVVDKLALEAGYHFTYIDFHGDRFASLDRTENEVPVRATYQFNDTTMFYIKSAWKIVEFRNPGLNNFYVVDSRVGMGKQVIEKVLTFDLNVGVAVARVKNDNGQNPSVGASYMVWDGVVSYTPKEELSMTLALYCTPRVNLAVTQPIRPVYGARVDATYKMLERKLSLSVGGNYERIDNLPPDSDQVFLSGNLRAQYQLRGWAFVYANYVLTARQADGVVQDYVDNKVMLGAGITL